MKDEGYYQLGDAPEQSVGSTTSIIDAPTSWFSGVDHDAQSTTAAISAMGILATHNAAVADPIAFHFDRFAITPFTPVTPSTDPPSLLDAFNRADGAVGTSWQGGTAGYEIASSQLYQTTSDGGMYWGTPFGANQEAAITLSQIDRDGVEVDLHLKNQNPVTDCPVLEAWYQPANDLVQIWTCDDSRYWQQQGNDIAVHFADGDQFGARAFADGTVDVLKNGTVVGQVQVDSSWPYMSQSGRIGLWMIGGAQVLDDFTGGTIAITEATPTPTATITDTPTGTIVVDTPTATTTFTPTETIGVTHTPTVTDTVSPTSTETVVATDTPTVIATGTATPSDTTAPSAPTGLGATHITTNSMTLAWDAATDDVGVASYDVYQDTTLLGSPATTTFTATQLTSSTIYTFTVRARDVAGNVSVPSGKLLLRTKDDTPPSVPTNLRVGHATSTQVALEWDAASDNVEIAGYDLYASGTLLAQTQDAFFTIENLQVLANYAFSVAARDSDGNTSAPSAVLTVTVPDTDPPTAPATLDVASVTDTTATFTWAAASDNVAVTSYTLYTGSTAVLTTTAQTVTVSGLQPNSLFSATVRARDMAGNEVALRSKPRWTHRWAWHFPPMAPC